jgi:hypothetical protein
MKPIMPFILFMAVGFILVTGCITVAKKAPLDSGLNKTINVTPNVTPDLKGSLKVSISGLSYPANLSVVLDDKTVGVVNPTTPLYLMVSEGNHTVKVCESSVCKQENVTSRFGTYLMVDFSEQIQKDAKFPNPTAKPTARILEYYRNGETISVDVEFFNPSKKDLTMSVEISVGYSYIDSRSGTRKGDSVGRKLVQNVRAGQRITDTLNLHFASDNSLNYSSPIIEELIVK